MLAFTTSIRPSLRADRAIINSAKFPKKAVQIAPIVGPLCSAISSVASLSSSAIGMMPVAETIKQMSKDENNYEDAGKRDLEKREDESGLFEAEQQRREKADGGTKEEAKPTALGKSADWQKKNEDRGEEYKMGWVNIPVSQFPSGGLFYVEDIKVQIRAATVKEIMQR
mgnify:CR=1 FL=1